MTRRIIITAEYKADADETFRAALDFQELMDAMKGIARYEMVSNNFDIFKEGETYFVSVRLRRSCGQRRFPCRQAGTNFQGMSSSSLVILWSAMLARTCVSQAWGSTPLSLAVSIRV